jgi:hypothetical protein
MHKIKFRKGAQRRALKSAAHEAGVREEKACTQP